MSKQYMNVITKLVLFSFLIIFLIVILCAAGVPSRCGNAKASSVTFSPVQPMEPEPTAVPLKRVPLLFKEINYVIYYEPVATKDFLDKIRSYIAELENIDELEYTPKGVKLMRQELLRLKNIEEQVASDLAHYVHWENEYYYAAKVWEYFMQRGFSEVVTCAIIGNMMIEAGGRTLDLQPTVYDPPREFYGLCQWSLYYRPEMADTTFEYQLEYLETSMPYEYKIFGKCYKEGFTYDDFLAMTDPAEAALAFAQVYERCRSGSYKLRQDAAVEAYEYFNLKAPIN